MPLGEVVKEIQDRGLDPNPPKEQIAERVKILRGRVDSMSLYEITEYELNLLEQGSPASLHLNFSIFLLSIATSFLITLLSTPIASYRVFTVFVVITAVGFSVGGFLLLLWYKTHRSVKNIIEKIKRRILNVEEDDLDL
ncbi:MAG: hypothetical protein ETSY1_43610 [Candidatus Entotheonella factor]|uniref:Uncharacterized protein n=1 Tax=Entotheonella factor TaxID=1429438 RepID=W4L3H4_ENTF1|nr:MAG: hypothetical protein ETSY1_43610 [Candidatus Entotheonella factor]